MINMDNPQSQEEPTMQIVVGKEIDAERLARLRDTFPDVTFAAWLDDPDAMRDADAFLGRIPPDAFALSGDRLRWVQSGGAGIETIIAIPEIVAGDIVVTNTRGAHAPLVAEHTFAMLLALARGIPAFLQDQKDHRYRRKGEGVAMDGLYGKRMLIIGMGNIGSAIAKRAAAFEMKVVGLEKDVSGRLGEESALLPMDHLDNELERADVLVVAVPYTPETDNLIDARRIALLKPGAVVLGISRGKIIDEDALIARLREGTLAGAGLDVYAEEPVPADSPLWDTPNLVMTPHCAPVSPITDDREMDIIVENVRRFVEGEPLLNTCDKVAGF
jgi:phosphoglycerate dehydrogenase-like enzyme